MEHIGVRETVKFLGLTFNVETILMTWLAMFIVVVVAGLAVRSLKVIPTGAEFYRNSRHLVARSN